MKVVNHTILGYLLLLGSIVYIAGCSQGNEPPSDAFWQAVKEGTVQDVKRFIEKERVNVNAQDKDGMTALHHVIVFNPDVDIAKYLIEKGADVNAKSHEGWTPFHVIAPYIATGTDSRYGLAILLLENGADVNAKNSEGKTPLDLITEVGALFTKAGLDFFRKAAEQGNPKAKEILQQLEK